MKKKSFLKRVKKTLEREKKVRKYMKMGYSRLIAHEYLRNIKNQPYQIKKAMSEKENYSYESGYLPTTLVHYNEYDTSKVKYIKDIDYIAMSPFNNSLSKVISNMILAKNYFGEKKKIIPQMYASIIRRNGKMLIFDMSEEKEIISKEAFVKLIKEGPFILKPSFFDSTLPEYIIYYSRKKEKIFVRSCDRLTEEYSWDYFSNKVFANFVLIKPLNMGLKHLKKVEVFIGNSFEKKESHILETILHEWDEKKNKYIQKKLSLKVGKTNEGLEILAPDICKKIVEKTTDIRENLEFLNYYSVTFVVGENDIRLYKFSVKPLLPEYPFSKKLNDFLKEMLKYKNYKQKRSFLKEYYNLFMMKVIRKYARKGTRDYMQKLWIKAIKDDLVNTKKISLSRKIWAWKRGFLSFRIHQYGLTEDNYMNYLADYDYIWLNRINNLYQCFIDDKTVFRYTYENFKNFLPKYYFLVYKKFGNTFVKEMSDFKGKNKVDRGVSDVIKLLKDKKILAFKPSAGLHGDGFYKLEWKNTTFLVNGKVFTQKELIKLIESQKSFYIVTDFLFMEEDLRKIYPNSINTIRMMVVNNEKNQPKILQAYMRIGSSSSGFTDNVAYGGLVAKIDIETGYYYGAEKLLDHFYEGTDKHPDTNVRINGYIKKWDTICQNVINMAKYVGELEYLGFDVALSDEGMKILEINLHQDLHKVGEYTDEINEFFRKKIKRKLYLYKIEKKHLYRRYKK